MIVRSVTEAFKSPGMILLALSAAAFAAIECWLEIII